MDSNMGETQGNNGPPKIPPKPRLKPNITAISDNSDGSNNDNPPLVPPRPAPRPTTDPAVKYYSPLSKVPLPQNKKQEAVTDCVKPATTPLPPISITQNKPLQNNQQRFSSIPSPPSMKVAGTRHHRSQTVHDRQMGTSKHKSSLIRGNSLDSGNNSSSQNRAGISYPHQQMSEYEETASNLYEALQQSSDRKELREIIQSCDQLPMTVGFCDSIYGYGDGSFTFLNTELFDIHFMKESFVANVETSSGGKFKVPLQVSRSCFKFQPTYSFDDVCNTVYTAAQLIKLSQLPKIAIVMKNYSVKKKNPPCEFKKGEVLLLKHRVGSKSIESISLTDNGCKKSIPKSSDLQFTTNPSPSDDQLMFSFSTLVNFDLPIQAMIIAPKKFQPIFSSLSVIRNVSKETSVIASFNDPSQTGMYEIFTDVPIDFQVCKCSAGQKQLLAKKSLNMYETFDPSKVERVIVNTRSHYQREIYQLQGSEGWKEVTNIVHPVNSIDDSESKKQSHATTAKNVTNHCPNKTVNRKKQAKKDRTDHLPVSAHEYDTPTLPSPTMGKKDSMLTDASTSSSIGSTSTASMHPNLCYLPSSSLTSQHNSLPHKQTKNAGSPSLSRSPTFGNTADNTIGIIGDNLQANIKLEDLSPNQVLELLDKMGLSRYKENFGKENISGGLLKELDADILENELGITSKLHRIKLLRIINEKELVDSYFTD